MSFAYNSAFQSNQDENGPQGLRRMKRESLATKTTGPGATKRAALGTISLNAERKQPFRAAKANVNDIQDENAFARPAKSFGIPDSSQPFTVHVDAPPVEQLKNQKIVDTSLELKLDEAITSLPRFPLSTVLPCNEVVSIGEEDSSDSPMILDTTIEDGKEKKVYDREAIILSMPEYAEDIYEYLREAELKHRPKFGYMKKQPDITSSMRSILIDWLVEVGEEYKLHRETVFLATNYIDRFLSQMSVLRGKLQLVGAASMFLAAKYEEIYPPDISEFVYITDDTYTKKQILRMEHLILKVLSFDVAVPTSNWFCERLLDEIDANEKVQSLAMYLTELTLIDADPYMKYTSSIIATSAVCLANLTVGNDLWSSTLKKCSGYEMSQLVECLQDLHQTFSNAPSHPQQAIREKYKSSKFQQVSTLSPPRSLQLIG